MPSTNVKASGNFDDLNRSIQNTAKMVADLGLKLSGIQAAGKAFDMVTGAIGGTVNAMAKVGQAAIGVEALGKSAVAMGMGLLQGNAALEMTTISFKTLLGSGQAAQDMIKTLTDFAAHTPFELSGLEANTQRLLAFGFGAKDVIPLMTSLGDAIAALGGTQDNLNSLVYVMGQMRSEAHLNAGDIMQMTNLGIPALQMLADHYKVTTGEMQTMISKGLVPGKEAVDIFTTGLEQRYGGMMAAQSATFSGMISNLQDWAHATMITLTKPLFEPAKQALQSFLDFVQSPAGEAAVNKLAGYIQRGVDSAIAAFKMLEPHIKPFIQGLIDGGESIMNRFTPALSGLIPKLETLYQKFEPLIGKALEFYKAVSPISTGLDVLSGILSGGLMGGLTAFEQHIEDAGKVFGINLTPAITSFNKFLGSDLLPKLLDFAKTVGDNLMPILRGMGQFFEQHVLPLISSLADTFEKYVLPALGRFGDFLVATVFPALGTLMDWIGAKIVPVIGQLVAVVLDKVIPTLFNWWQVIATFLQPIIEAIADFIVKDFIPNFSKLADTINKNVMPVLKNIAGFLGGTLGAAFSIVGKIIGGLIDIIGRLAGAVGDVFKGDFGGAWDALTGKTNTVTDATKDLMKQNDDLFKQLNSIGKVTLSDTGSSFNDLTNKLFGNKKATDDLTAAKAQLQKQSTDTYNAAQKEMDELAQKYKEGKISADQYHQGIQDINDRLADFQTQMNLATQQLAQGKKPVDDYTGSLDKLKGLFDSTNSTTMQSSKDQIDALTKKYLDGKGTYDDYRKALDDLSKNMDGNGKAAIEASRSKMDDLNKKFIDGRVNLDDYKTGYNNIVQVMETDGKTAQEKAKDRLDDLNKKFMDGSINFDSYKKGVDDVNASIAIYNQTQIKDINLKTNFRAVADDINTLITNIGRLTQTGPVKDYPTSHTVPPVYVPYTPPQYAAGTSYHPGGLALIAEKGMELINMGHNQLMLAVQPMLLDLPRGAQVYNNQQTRAMLPNPASAQQISNMYQTSYANRSWDYSQSNSNNSTQNYYINGQQVSQWSFGQQMRWNTAR